MKKKLMAVLALLLAALPARAQTPQYALAVSSQANRSAANFLTSASVVTGNAYVFTSSAGTININPTGIGHICYWLDRAATGTADHCEYGAPYDLKGTFACPAGVTGSSCGGPWDTTALADGWHTLTQIVTLSTGATETDGTPFRIYNGTVLTVGATYDDGSAVAGTVVLQTVSASNVATTIASLPLSTGGAASYRVVLQTDTIYVGAVELADGTVMATFPFTLPSILKVDPAALRSAAVTLVFRLSDQSLKQATPQVSFVF